MSLLQVRYEDEDEDEGPQPDATLEQGAPLPVRLVGTFPPELASVPLEDIDPYYHNQKVSGALDNVISYSHTAAAGRPSAAVVGWSKDGRAYADHPSARRRSRRQWDIVAVGTASCRDLYLENATCLDRIPFRF